MATILVTGGTAQLGRPTVALLRASGNDVRVLSRKPGNVVGDLATGAGIRDALDGVDTLVHLASAPHGPLFEAAVAAGVAHTVYISIVGIDDIPLGYYRGKLADERALVASELPHTILRATQFHSFVDGIFASQRLSPLLIAPAFSFQPIAVDEVAARLASLAIGAPQGRVADIGGPEQKTALEFGRQWRDAVGARRPMVRVSLPGATMRGFAGGHNLVPGTPYGRGTFTEYLQASPRA
ncbi:MAG: NmrA family transcriptional regulator [Microbacteriaceae bacterium]|jgi:uncharacterized protein YbjT (DUF2867 family)|nr:NmrA family transcriptional regulator [Microbacteriaceae bacterium]